MKKLFSNYVFSNIKKNILSIIFLFLIFSNFGCTKKFPEIKWEYSDADVIGTPPNKQEQIDIDIYVDATTSMEGFAVNNSSTYSQFLDQIEASTLSAWKKADAKYYKFGQIIKPVNRAEYLTAKNNLKFYRERGVFLKTYIDSVVNRTDSNRLSVLISDLFQDEGDVNIMVDRIKEKCFSRGVNVSFLGIKSEFDGKVFDVPSYPKGYGLKTDERPFYAIIFGNSYNMELLFESLKSKPFVKDENFLILSKNIIKSFNVSLIKTKDSKAVNKKAPRQEIKNSFDFSMQEDGKEAQFDLEITFDRLPRFPDFSEKSMELISYKKSISDPIKFTTDSVLTDDIKIENIQRTGNKVTATIRLKNHDPSGNYSYLVYLKSNQLNGLITPDWIKEFSTDDPVPGSPTENKTYNLEKFISTLLVARSSITPINLAKFYINIFKR
jgi:hypothetical protein